MSWLSARRWNPYAAGVGIGLVACATMLALNKTLGTSSSFVHMAGLVESTVAPEHVRTAEYFAKEISATSPMFDWQMFLVIGVLIGAFTASRLASGGPVREQVPNLWAWRFGPSRVLRYAAAFFFGAIMIIGARLAGGCTSGHAISGALQLAVSSWTFFIAFFASGVVTAFALFGVQGRSHVLD